MAEIQSKNQSNTTNRVEESIFLMKRLSFIGNHLFNNGIKGVLNISKKDIRNLKWETGKDRNLRGKKEELATKVLDVVVNGQYEGWAYPDEGKHSETAFFSYFSKEYGEKVYLALRKLKTDNVYKPYAFYNEDGFRLRKDKIKKGEPIM